MTLFRDLRHHFRRDAAADHKIRRAHHLRETLVTSAVHLDSQWNVYTYFLSYVRQLQLQHERAGIRLLIVEFRIRHKHDAGRLLRQKLLQHMSLVYPAFPHADLYILKLILGRKRVKVYLA